jgi:hypothetical protein
MDALSMDQHMKDNLKKNVSLLGTEQQNLEE